MPKKSVIIIGAGIAGLSTGVYAQLNGFQSRIYEMHTQPGGLVTAWKRKGYLVDGCIHWLTGSSKAFPQYYKMWEDIGLIQGREMVDPEVFVRWESRDGQALCLYTDPARLEQHLLELSPADRPLIRDLCRSIRAFAGLGAAEPANPFERTRETLKMIPLLPHFLKWGRMSLKQVGDRFTSPFLRRAFSELWFPEISAMGLLFTLAMLSKRGAGYPLGGSLPMAKAVEERYISLGGEVHYEARVSEILTAPGAGGNGARATGIRLSDGREETADIVISAADAHATLYQMLGDRFTPPAFRAMFESAPIFPPIVFIGLGVDRQFPELPAITGGLDIELDEPITVAGRPVGRLSTMIYNFDPHLAPAGKTAVTVMFPTSYAYWKDLYNEGPDRERYEAEKQRVALQVIERLDRRFPGLSGQVEMADVATPVTFERYTGNWQGSFEGWLPTPQSVMKPIPKTLPGLANFYMVGQWVQPGGGLPSGVMTAREVVQKMCKQDGVKFTA